MRRELFLRIFNDVTGHDNFFKHKPNATGRMGCNPILKMTAAIRILVYGISTDLCDEYMKVNERTAIQCLKKFCDAVIELYADQYIRLPNKVDIARLLREWEERGFPTGSHNDVNILDHSPVFQCIINGTMPSVNYEVNGCQRTLRYYLSDGIYPKWATLIQTIPHPMTTKEKLFAQRQETVRNDVEWVFSMLQIRWAITHEPVYYWKKEYLGKIMKTCIILHNMIIEDKPDANILNWTPPPDESVSLPHYHLDPSFLATHISARLCRIRNTENNLDLRKDLMNHLWNK